MKIIIAGCRTVRDQQIVRDAVEESGLVGQMTELVHGGCRGVDSIAHYQFEGIVPVKVFLADWGKHGKAAGPLRNAEMAKYADALIAIWDGNSRGTKNMIHEMEKLGKKVFIHMIPAKGNN